VETQLAIQLSQVDEGRFVSIANINAGRGLRMRLTAMGLRPGTRIQVLRNGKSGPIVVSIKNTRMALGRGVADKIMAK